MIVKRPAGGFGKGYTAISEEGGTLSTMLMDFGILRLDAGETYESKAGKERAFLLMNGAVTFTWSGDAGSGEQAWERHSLLDEEPAALHVPLGVSVTISAAEVETELAIQAVTNETEFAPKFWKPGDYRRDRFGEGTLQDTSTRTVSTIFDAATAPDSAMVLGEVINHPGKWSSYPPHDHAHPEIYHYRFFPRQGWGHAECEDDVFKVQHEDTYAIPPGVTHSQLAAPGYAMYYIWAIPHLPGDRFGPDSRNFRKEHEWVMDGAAPIWPDASVEDVIKYQENT